MDAEEVLLDEYQRNRGSLEDEEDEVKRFIRNGENYIEEALSRAHYVLSKRESGAEQFQHMQRELQRHTSYYLEELKQERKELILQQEEVERYYRNKRQELDK